MGKGAGLRGAVIPSAAPVCHPHFSPCVIPDPIRDPWSLLLPFPFSVILDARPRRW